MYIPIRTVLVTGANGYLASHIVKLLLEKGYDVHACVRDATNESSVRHLLHLSSTLSSSKLRLFSTGDMGDKSLYGRYDEPLTNVDAVIHAATPLSPKLSGKEFDGESDVLRPGMEGTQELLDSILKKSQTSQTSNPIQCFVLTSSMSAAAPSPEPFIKDESHWSDDVAQLSRGNYYGCLKTRQERLCRDWSRKNLEGGVLPKNFRFVAICPTMILGPPVGYSRNGDTFSNAFADAGASYTPSGTMGTFLKWINGGRSSAPNDSMSFVHVRDCAAMHVSAMENAHASERYFSLAESWHWNDILKALKELHPNMPSFELYEGEDVARPTQFDLGRMRSLGVEVVGVKEILEESVSFLKFVGALK